MSPDQKPPPSTAKSSRRLLSKRGMQNDKTSLGNEFNKKLLQKGGAVAGGDAIHVDELPPEAAKYIKREKNDLAVKPL